MVMIKLGVLVATVGSLELVWASSPWLMILNQIDEVMLHQPPGLQSAQRALEFGKRPQWWV
jgi:hypothetical protein